MSEVPLYCPTHCADYLPGERLRGAGGRAAFSFPPSSFSPSVRGGGDGGVRHRQAAPRQPCSILEAQLLHQSGHLGACHANQIFWVCSDGKIPKLNLKLPTIYPRPYTLNPQPSTLNPQPSILNLQPGATRSGDHDNRRLHLHLGWHAPTHIWHM